MVTNEQVRKLMKLIKTEKTLSIAAAKSGMCEKTARKWRNRQKLPDQYRIAHTWKTRKDPFADVWSWVEEQLQLNPGLHAKTLFVVLQQMYPDNFQDSQIRTFQRKVKQWRAQKGPAKEIYFAQVYRPGDWSESDFTSMNSLNITIAGCPFNHLLYHFVLPYSNWEDCTLVYSESFESLSIGLQNALWKLGGVPRKHKTDRLSSAVNKLGNPEEFTHRYQALLNHYGLKGHKIQVARPNENGDVEQSHYRLKQAVDQALMLRFSRDFSNIKEYESFIQKILDQLNIGRKMRLREEINALRDLPLSRCEDFRKIKVKVGSSSTIHVLHNTYSVHSRLIGEQIEVRVHACHIEIWYGQKCQEQMPRLRGESKHHINYRHIIDWLVRKPGAFDNYRYRDALFPTSQFRFAYDHLCRNHSQKYAVKEYLKILELAAKENESSVNEALRTLISTGSSISSCDVKELVLADRMIPSVTDIEVKQVDVSIYDELLMLAKVNV